MLRFKQFWRIRKLLMQVRLSCKGCYLAHTAAEGLDLGACIDKCFGHNHVPAIPRLEVA